MNTYTRNDGSKTIEVFKSLAEAIQGAATSFESGTVKKVTTEKMDYNYPCPCKSGMKFGRCCGKALYARK